MNIDNYQNNTNQTINKNMRLEKMDMITACLKGSIEEKSTAKEIAEWIKENHSDYFKDRLQYHIDNPKKNTRITSAEALVTQLSAEISGCIARYQNNCIKDESTVKIKDLTGRSPKQFYYTDKTDEEETDSREISDNQEQTSKDSKLTEKELYPLLIEYLSDVLGITACEINSSISSNKEGKGSNYWLFADIVGTQYLDEYWDKDIQKCAMNQFDSQVKLWSFEVKKTIERGTLRENFFQAVSNSSWANFGYLVATNETIDKELLAELTMLSAWHGIGYIRLDIDRPAESQILLPAREKPTIDWNIANRIAKENKEFKEYIKKINNKHAVKKG